jgi:predicted aldo/keto reductase-like oxidoreductase
MSKIVVKKVNKFKGVDENPSLLGFGCMRFPKLDPDKPDIDEVLSEKMIDTAYKAGVNYFDTAYPYHQRLSEKFVGKVLKKYPRESFNLATKMPGWMVETVEDAERIFNEQLETLQVDYFDYYLCHALNKSGFEVYKKPGVMDFLYRMKAEGKIRHLGFSFHDTPDVLDEIINTYEWDFVQLQLNYLDWDFQDAKKQYEIVQNYGVPVIVMEPVRGGTLATLSGDARDILLTAKPDKSIASWAIRYAASKEHVMVVLSGMSNMEQTLDNIATLTDFEPIDDKDQIVIEQALDLFLKSNTIPCTNCKYCMPCPEGVDIPLMFRIYNQYAISKFERAFIFDYEKVEESKRAEFCVACGICLSKCPQAINIPELMEEIRNLYKELNQKHNDKS